MSNTAIVGDSDGVKVTKKRNGSYQVEFGFDRQLYKLMAEVSGVEMAVDGKTTVATVPGENLEALTKAVTEMRYESKHIAADLDAITKLATASAAALQKANGSKAAEPMLSTFKDNTKFYAGEIINANGRFVAQLTGFGKEDGAAFVAIHRRADLDRGNLLMKGEEVGIKYNDKFVGVVTDLSKSKTVEELAADFEKNAGLEIDGVKAYLTPDGAHVAVAFKVNPTLMARIRRIDGAEFDKDAEAWLVPADKKEFALRAVQDMRHEFKSQQADFDVLKGIAESKIDNPKVAHAFVKDGLEYFGKVVGVGKHLVLQKTGPDQFKTHNLDALSEKPEVDQNLSIKYAKGKGTVVDQDKERAQKKALGR